MLSPGTCVIVHGKPVNRKSLLYHVTQGWYIGPSLDHYIFIYCYMPLTGIVRITNTLQYIPNTFAFQKTTTEYYLQQAIGYIIVNIKEPPKTRTFLSYRYAKKAMNHNAHILQIITAQSCLQILPLPPMLP